VVVNVLVDYFEYEREDGVGTGLEDHPIGLFYEAPLYQSTSRGYFFLKKKEKMENK
jgi:hypothetical protein